MVVYLNFEREWRMDKYLKIFVLDLIWNIVSQGTNIFKFQPSKCIWKGVETKNEFLRKFCVIKFLECPISHHLIALQKSCFLREVSSGAEYDSSNSSQNGSKIMDEQNLRKAWRSSNGLDFMNMNSYDY